MHPALADHLNPGCIELVERLNACHTDHRWAKFLGKCNALSEALNKCLAQEFEVRRKQQLKEARARRAHYEAKWKQMDEEDRLHAEFEQAQQARKQQG
ncbi:Respiratory chain complex assembly or maintenance protein [Coemansia sp. RSA 1085]|nr:Respiratory chain complex assembly or maintenance protein [Coemansia sp. RSA 1085]